MAQSPGGCRSQLRQPPPSISINGSIMSTPQSLPKDTQEPYSVVDPLVSPISDDSSASNRETNSIRGGATRLTILVLTLSLALLFLRTVAEQPPPHTNLGERNKITCNGHFFFLNKNSTIKSLWIVQSNVAYKNIARTYSCPENYFLALKMHSLQKIIIIIIL